MFTLSTQTVKPEWIDYNGHMNVAWYTQAFDIAFDEMLSVHLGVDESYVRKHGTGPFAVQSQFTYLSELLENDRFYARMRFLDFAPRKIQIYAELLACDDERICCCMESLSVHVDHASRRAVPFPDAIYQRIRAVHETTRDDPWPDHAGQSISMNRQAKG